MLVAAALFGMVGCRRHADAPKKPQAYVTLAQMQKRIFQKHLPVKGIVQPIDSTVISAQTEGMLVNMNIVEGGYAKAGDVLFCTDRSRLEAVAAVKKDEIDILESMLERTKIKAETAEITFRQTERDYERERKLREANVNSLASFEAAETAYRKATLDIADTKIDVIKTQALLQKARSNLDIALRDLELTMYKAPYDCVVTERFADPHEYVTIGRKILKIENHDRLQVVCSLESSHYDKVAVGRTRAEIFVNGQSACSGIVTFKAPSIEPDTQTFRLKIAIPQNTSIICGSPCDVKLILLEKEAWGIPGSALMNGDGSHAVAFIQQEDGTAKTVQVVIGIVDGDFTEVVNTQDLRGATFVTSGQEGLEDGMTIGARQ
jgi:RND family efflux transporter MFP subunit